MPRQIVPPTASPKPRWWIAPLVLVVVLAGLFWRSFLPDYVHFSNDTPLGVQNADWLKLPSAIFGAWNDLNGIGSSSGSYSADISATLSLLLGPVGFAKFLAPAALLIAGLGACFFFRQLNLSPLAAALGALAAMLNSTFFSDACWGVASHEIAAGMDFFALGLVVANTPETPWLTRWARLALAGLCVGMNVIEAADIGALYSILVAAFVFFKSIADPKGTALKNIISGVSRVAVISVFAGIIAYQTVIGLVGTEIVGIAGTAQDTETKAAHWDFATQWSEPKKETLGLFVPGLFGYKMDTPKDMMPLFEDAYKGGNYWGGVGRSPELDRYFDNGSQGAEPGGPGISMRFSGGGNYCGILVVLVAFWAVAQSLRRRDSVFEETQRRCIWFWAAVIFLCLPVAWGRFAPFSKTNDSMMFYALLYHLPYFSTIRNPIKFLTFLSWAIVILFGYGVHALSRRYLEVPAGKSGSLSNWWAKAGVFDRKWTFACAAGIGVSLLGWLIYASEKPSLVRYLQTVGFGDESAATEIAAFSIKQAGWFVLLFTLAAGLCVLVIAGVFAGKRAKLGFILLGLLLVIDLGRADLPYVIHWDYKEKYEVGSLNPVESFLKDKPYEHRVAYGLPRPLETPGQFGLFEGLYNIEWTQHHFLYYNIQSLDIIQMPRMPADLAAFNGTFQVGIKQDASGQWVIIAPETFPRVTRLWQLTNTRYLLGPAPLIDLFNQQFDPEQHRFRIVQRFNVMPKPGTDMQELQDGTWHGEKLTAVPNNDGDYALFDFTGALPRAKLYSNWQVNTNDTANLKTLADPNFDPAKTVLISTPQNDLPSVATNENSGAVDFKSYSPRTIIFDANATAPSVLLLNDKFDPDWRVTVDGKPAELLRCNFIMRGVYLTPGEHTVEFQFSVPDGPIYVTMAALMTGAFLCGYLCFAGRRTGRLTRQDS
jgi:hypothetical protein